jgi:hypothetical protein
MAAIDDQILALEKAIVSPATAASFLPAMKEALAKLKLDKANAPSVVTPVKADVVPAVVPNGTQVVEVNTSPTGILDKIRANVPTWGVYVGLGIAALGSLLIVKKIMS